MTHRQLEVHNRYILVKKLMDKGLGSGQIGECIGRSRQQANMMMQRIKRREKESNGEDQSPRQA